MLYSDGKLNIELQEFVASLKVVTVIRKKFKYKRIADGC